MSKEYIVPLSEDEAFYGYKGMTVELIRCKDCKFFMKGENINGRGWCSFSQHGCPMPDDYCSDAERKEE